MPRLTFKRLRQWGVKIGFEREWYLVIIAAIIGLIMGAVATAFILPLRWIENAAANADRSLLLWFVPTMPIAGALLTGVVLAIFGEKGHAPGVSTVMYSIYRKKARLELKLALGKWLASTLTIGSGGSAGAEGPIVTIGSVIGSNIARLFKARSQSTATLLGCGAAAGIASVFNAPIAGIFFVMEILLRDFSLRTFTPIVIASVVSSAWTRGFLGDETLFGVGPDFFKHQSQFTMLQIPTYLLLGIICGVAAAAFTRGLAAAEQLFTRVRLPVIVKPAIGAAILGIMGLIYVLLVRTPHGVPEFYGNGYPVIKGLLDPNYYTNNGSPGSTMLSIFGFIALLATLKAIGTWLTIGSGGSGGLFAPSLLMGAFTGGGVGCLLNWVGMSPAASPAHYALVGMAAMIAATAHAPLTGILLVYEITQSYQIILPLMFAAVISTIVSRLIYRESVYTIRLTQLGVRVGAVNDLTVLRRLAVNDVPLAQAVIVHEHDSAQRLLELSEQQLVSDFVVVDSNGRYVGIVTGAELSAALVYREALPLLQVHELRRADLPTVTMDETLDVALDKFSTHDAQSLAVLNDGKSGTVRGLLTRARLMQRYQAALSGE